MSTRIRGTALVPGVSKNNRFYSAAVVRDMVTRAQPKVQAGQLVMKTHHGAGDDTTRVAGVVRSLALGEDGSARFEAELADTAAGRDIAALVKGPRPFVNGVSICGFWTGKVRKVNIEGLDIEAGEGLDLDSIDFTHRPGVDGARIAAEAAVRSGQGLILEEAPWPVTAAEPGVRDLAAMPLEEFNGASASYLARAFGDPAERPPPPWSDPRRWQNG
jgi:hypothetical protein